MYLQLSLEGPTIVHLPEFLKLEDVDKNLMGVQTEIERGLSPIILKGGYILSHSKTEGIQGQYLTTHSYLNSWRGTHDSEDGHLRYFLQNLAINRFEACFEVAGIFQRMADPLYETLGKQCLKYMEMAHAETAFRACKNVGMVYAIKSIANETEKYVLMGHVASMLHKHDLAHETRS